MASDGNDRIWKASHDNGGSGVFSWHGRPRLLGQGDRVCSGRATAFAAELRGGDGQRLHVSAEQEDQRYSNDDQRVKGGGDEER
jgi:hypothetical protein